MECDNCGKKISSWKARYGSFDTVFCPGCFGTQEAERVIKERQISNENPSFDDEEDFLSHEFIDGYCKHCGWSREWAKNKSEKCPNHSMKEDNTESKYEKKKDDRRYEKEFHDINRKYQSDESKYGKVLGLKGKVTTNDIKKNYRHLSKKYHPDKVDNLGPEFKEIAQKKMKEINEAYSWFKSNYNF